MALARTPYAHGLFRVAACGVGNQRGQYAVSASLPKTLIPALLHGQLAAVRRRP